MLINVHPVKLIIDVFDIGERKALTVLVCQEFDSDMRSMQEMALYDTGVTAQYGDRLLTLSTCDYEESDGRFVVVAKRME